MTTLRRVVTGHKENAMKPYVAPKYEQTSTASELVAGRVGKKGTADTQVKLYTAGYKPICWFDVQTIYQGLDGDNYEDSDYAYNGKDVNIIVGGNFELEGLLLNGETVTLGDELMATTSGKLVLRGKSGVWDPCVAIALESVVASADTLIRVLNKIGVGSAILKKTETLTVVTYQVTLSYIPYMLEYVDVATGTTLGGKLVRTTGTFTNAGNLPTGHCHLARSTKVITFSSTDAPLTVTVEYLYNA